mgnify:CR=1 FL=1|tara:strand:+ start:3674 stop:4102 length:429 start_codon:yes stop_codon:yes gene_type:complete
MLFDEQRLANLPIKPEYKERIRMICSKQETQQQCQVLAKTPDQKLVQMFSQIEGKVNDWKENGVPPEIEQGLKQGGQGQPPQKPPQPRPGIGALPQGGPPQGGPPQMPPQQKPVPQGMAPSQMSRTPMPMDIPSGGIGGVRR